MRNPMRGALFSEDVDRGDGFENGPKRAPLCANPMRWRRGRGAGQEKEQREGRWGGERRGKEEGREEDGEGRRRGGRESYTLCAGLCAGPLISQDLDRRAGSKRAQKGTPYA